MMNRRTFLALGAAAGGALALGTALLADGYRSWVRRCLKQALPGHDFEPEGLSLFAAEYQARHADAMKFRVLGALESVVEARSLLPKRMTRHVEDEERDMLTEFLLGSDFFQHHAQGAKEIIYSGRAVACKSPFAVFDL